MLVSRANRRPDRGHIPLYGGIWHEFAWSEMSWYALMPQLEGMEMG